MYKAPGRYPSGVLKKYLNMTPEFRKEVRIGGTDLKISSGIDGT